MEWKLIDSNYNHDTSNKHLLDVLLKNRGVNDVNALLNVNKSNTHHWTLMKNMKEAIEIVMKNIELENEIHIRIDPDCDGATSFTELYTFLLKNYNVKCSFNTPTGKQHGIHVEELKKIENFDTIKLFIFPDGGSFDNKAQEELINLGKEVLVLDHHTPEEGEVFKQTKAIVVNPQLDDYPNKALSGVGVVHKFCEGVSEIDNKSTTNEFLDIVALGMIADNMDLRDLETRYYVLEGIKLMKQDMTRRQNGEEIVGNSFIQAIIETKEEKKLKHINIHSIGWEISPLMNGMARSGTQKEKHDMFRALIGETEEIWYQPRRANGSPKDSPKPDKVLKTLQQEMVRVCTNAKSRQDRAKAKGVKEINARIEEKKLNENKILIVDGSDLESSSLSGLVAMGLANKYNKPCLILRKKDDETFGGSGRNCNMSPIPDLKKFLSDSGQFNNVSGHPNAFGINIDRKSLFTITENLENMLKDVEMKGTYFVDYTIPVGRVSKKDVLEVGKLKDIWGNTIPCPRFAITNISLKASDIELIGDRRNIIKFKKGDFTFIKFFANEEYLNAMTTKNKKGFAKSPKEIVLDIIGEFETNEYEGKEYPQINIVDFNVKKKEEVLF